MTQIAGIGGDGIGPEVTEQAQRVVEQVKELGMTGVTLFSINKENERYRGEYARSLAETLYL